MACFPHPPVGTPPRRFVVAASSAINDQEPSGLRPRRALCIATRSADGYAEVSCVPAAGGRDKRAMDGARPQIGRAHVWTPVTNATPVCRLLLEQKKRNEE